MKKIFNITFLGLTLVACIGFSSNNSKIGNASTNLTSEAAKKIALNHAKVSENNATFTKIKLNTSNGRSVYNIQFFVNGKEYNYTIDANTGKVY